MILLSLSRRLCLKAMSVYFESEISYLSIQQNLSNAASLQFSIALGIITLFRGSKLNFNALHQD